MICLTREELTELSGYKRQARVAKWLRANGFAFYLGADGWPRVLRDTQFPKPKTLTVSKPNVSALMELQHAKGKDKQTRSS